MSANTSVIGYTHNSGVKDYFDLLKLRVMSLVIFTGVAGIFTANIPSNASIALIAISLFALAVGAGASGALNMAFDADIDQKMKRTLQRPIPQGRVDQSEAYTLGMLLSLFSVMVMGLTANWLSAGLLAFTIFFYAVVYTIYLKRNTDQNIVIGGLAGALPPVIGSAIVSGEVSLQSAILAAIIFIWTPSHFWALALLKKEEYRLANVPMMPNTVGHHKTCNLIVLYSIALVALTFAPYLLNMLSVYYAVFVGILGAIYIYLALKLNASSVEAAKKPAIRLFVYSIAYLFLLFLYVSAENIIKLYMV